MVCLIVDFFVVENMPDFSSLFWIPALAGVDDISAFSDGTRFAALKWCRKSEAIMLIIY
jgi:hypothetical protein